MLLKMANGEFEIKEGDKIEVIETMIPFYPIIQTSGLQRFIPPGTILTICQINDWRQIFFWAAIGKPDSGPVPMMYTCSTVHLEDMKLLCSSSSNQLQINKEIEPQKPIIVQILEEILGE